MKTSIITLAISLLPFLSYAEEWMVEKDGITYVSYDETTCFAKSADKSITQAIIPSEIEGRKVTSIGEFCFDRCYYLEYVSLPNTVLSIEGGAFEDCKSLTAFEIPESVSTIDYYAFPLCFNIESFHVSPDNTHYCSVDGIIYDKEMTKLWFYPTARTGDLEIPEGVVEISSWAIRYSKVESVTLPSTLTSITEYCFDYCKSMKEIRFPDNCQIKEIGKYAFDACGSLIELVLPSSVEKIGYNCFSFCNNLKKLWLPESVRFTEGYEFYNCQQLDEVHVLSTEPYAICSTTFDWIKKITIPRYLFVPKGCREKYEAEPSWNDHFFILEEGQDRSEAGIKDVQADTQQDVPAYDLMGRVRNANSHNEILIKNGRKIVIR